MKQTQEESKLSVVKLVPILVASLKSNLGPKFRQELPLAALQVV